MNSHIVSKYKNVLIMIGLIIALKLFLYGFSYVVYDFSAHPNDSLIQLWDRWDAGIYKSIAQHAYTKPLNMDENYWAFKSHFPPLFPIAMYCISLTGIPIAISGILISLSATVAASIYLYNLALLEFKKPFVAYLAVIFLNLFPTSYFSNSIYSESLFLLSSIASFYYLRRQNYFVSSLLAGAAILTRLVGVVFIPVYVLFAAYDLYEHKTLKWHHFYLWLTPIVALVSFMLINQYYYGHYAFFLKDTISFNATKQLIIPFKETYHDLYVMLSKSEWRNRDFMMARGWNAVFAVMATILTTLGVKRLAWEYTLFSFLSILVFASLSWGISNARYVYAVFPIFIVLSTMNNKFIQGLLISLFFSGLLYFTSVFTGGGWGF